VSITSTGLLSTVIAIGAAFLALSLLVQVIQELYKNLTSSRSRAYINALTDFLGPHAQQLVQPGMIPDLQVRGPFQFLRRRPTGHLQPMDKDDLIVALERTAAPWIQRALTALKLETGLVKQQPGKLSPSFRQFLSQLEGATPGSPGYSTALDVREFFETWNVKTASPDAETFDTSTLLKALRQRFLPNVVRADESFTQLSKNFDHAYRRRNLRHTFTFGLLLAIVAEQPLWEIYKQAKQVPIEQAVAAAEAAQALYAQQPVGDTAAARSSDSLKAYADELVGVLRKTGTAPELKLNTMEFWKRRWNKIKEPDYLLGCLLTALLISFGAPFWNDITGALLRLYKGRPIDEPKEAPARGER
jgi:hypothetical protein